MGSGWFEWPADEARLPQPYPGVASQQQPTLHLLCGLCVVALRQLRRASSPATGFGQRAIGVIYADRVNSVAQELDAREQAAIGMLAELLDRSISVNSG